MAEVIEYRFRLRRALAATWTSLNDILLDGELGLERDTGNLKIGDGATPWAALPYFASGGPTRVISTSGNITLSAASHKSCMLLHSSGTITCPMTADAGFATDDIVEVRRQSGAVSFVAAPGAVLDFDNSRFSPSIYSLRDVVALKVISANTWALIGPLGDA